MMMMMMIVQWLEHCTANLQEVGVNLIHICISGIPASQAVNTLQDVPGVTSIEAKRSTTATI